MYRSIHGKSYPEISFGQSPLQKVNQYTILGRERPSERVGVDLQSGPVSSYGNRIIPENTSWC